MADKYLQHINQEEVKLSQSLTDNAGVLVGKFKDLANEAKKIQSTFNHTFHGSEKDVEELLNSSRELRILYGELEEQMKNFASLINDASEKMDSLADKYHVSREEVAKNIELLEQYSVLQNKLTDLLAEQSTYIPHSDEYENIEASINDTAKSLDKIKKMLNSSAVSAKMLYDYENGINSELQEALDYRQKISDETDKNKKLTKETTEHLRKGNAELQKTKEWTRKVENAFAIVSAEIKKGYEKLKEVEKITREIGRTGGLSSNQIKALGQNILSNYGDMAVRLGMTTKDIFKFQESYIKNTGRAIVLTNEQVESMAGLSKFTGGEAVDEIGKSIDEMGGSASNAIDYLTLSMAKAANQGLNIEQTSKNFAKNIKMASKYTFSKGVDGISKMTLLSQRLKFNMESIGNAIDKFSTIEGAISTSANLQMLGGSFAAQFSNPLQAMGEALLDAEGFTKRITDTFASTAVFNKETGQVEMSPIDKAKMKEAANQLGISYDELWNMAAQQAKIGHIERSVNGKNLSEEQKSFLANTAQYDTAKGDWYITKTDEDGNQKKVYFNDKNSNLSEELKTVQEQSDVAKATFNDVHAIRNSLDEYVKNRISETRTWEEVQTGIKDKKDLALANTIDWSIGWLKEPIKNFAEWLPGLVLAIGGLSATWGLGQLKGFSIKTLGRGAAKAFGGGGGSAKVLGGGAKSSAKKIGIGRAFNRAAIKVLGRGGVKAASKYIPVIGTALTVADGAYEGLKAQGQHNERLTQISRDTSLSKEDKAYAKYESRKERNKGVGKASGAAAGALAGAAIGTMAAPVVGTIIGSAIGGLVGYFGGGAAGEAIGEAVTGSYEDSKEKKELERGASSGNDGSLGQVVNDETKQNALLAIQEDVRKIRYGVSSPKTTLLSDASTYSQVQFNTNQSISQKPNYSNRTYIRENTNSSSSIINTPSVDRIALDVSGTLKIQGVGGKSQDLDINKLFDTPEFRNQLCELINNKFGRGGTVTNTRDKNSVQGIIGSYNTPTSNYSLS